MTTNPITAEELAEWRQFAETPTLSGATVKEKVQAKARLLCCLDEIERLRAREKELMKYWRDERLHFEKAAASVWTALHPTDNEGFEHPEDNLDFGIEDIKRLTARVAELEEAQRWRPATNPPPPGTDVLVYRSVSQHCKMIFYAQDGNWWGSHGIEHSITHWQPLPNAPQPRLNTRTDAPDNTDD